LGALHGYLRRKRARSIIVRARDPTRDKAARPNFGFRTALARAVANTPRCAFPRVCSKLLDVLVPRLRRANKTAEAQADRRVHLHLQPAQSADDISRRNGICP